MTGLIAAAGTASGFGRAQQELKVRNPEAYKAIEKLAATDLEAAVAKLREVAGQNRIYVPPAASGSSSAYTDPGHRQRGGMNGMRRGAGGRNGRNGRGGRGGMMGGNMFARAMAEAAVYEKFPAEAAALDKSLIETNKKYAELAAKAKVELPNNMDDNLRLLRTAAPKEFAEVMEIMKNDRRAGFAKLTELGKKHGINIFPARRGPNGAVNKPVEDQSKQLRTIGRPNMGLLRRKYPEQMKEYEQLRSSDPQKARALLEKLIEKDLESKTKK